MTFAGYAQFQDDALRAGMDAVIRAGLAEATPVLRALLVLYVLLGFMLLAGQKMTALSFVQRVIRAVVVLAVITASGVYTSRVRDVAFDTIPNSIASGVNGGGTRIEAAQQFDLVAQSAEALVAEVRAKNTGWGAGPISNAIASWFAGGAINAANAVIAGVWLLGRKLMAIVLTFGPWLICFELFDRTRGWVDQWIGKIVGLLVFQLASSALLQIMLRGEMTLFRNILENPTANVDEAVYNLFKIAGFIATDALTMLALPMICAIGSSAAASQGVGLAVAAGIPGRAMAAGRGAMGAAGRMARAARRRAGSRANSAAQA